VKVPSLWSTFDVSIYGTSDTTYSKRPIVWIPLYPCKSTQILAKKFKKYIHYPSVQIALTLCCGHWRSLKKLWELLEKETKLLSTHNNLQSEDLLRPAILLDKFVRKYPWNNLSNITWSVVNLALYNTLFNEPVVPQSKVLETTTVRILTSIINIMHIMHIMHIIIIIIDCDFLF
jgi:hypothetical protein